MKKFCSLLYFGKVLPKIKNDINKYMKSDKLTQDKIISIILSIIMHCGFRVGNIKYQKLYNSFGISNIIKDHIKFVDNSIIIKFVGKKGVINECNINDAELIRELITLTHNKKNKDYFYLPSNNIV